MELYGTTFGGVKHEPLPKRRIKAEQIEAPPPVQSDYEKVMAFKGTNIRYCEIAKATGVTYGKVYQWLRGMAI